MDERQWYYVKDGQQCGPVPQAQLIEMFQAKTLGPTTLVWTTEMANWCPASTVDALAAALSIPVQPGTPAGLPSTRPERPTAVTVFGVLNIVFGGMGLLFAPMGLIMTSAMPGLVDTNIAMKAWMLISSAVGFACAILLLATGIGLLYLKAWARTGSLVYGWFTIFWIIVGIAVNFAMITSGQFGPAQSMLPSLIGGMCGGLIGLIYPILLIVFIRRPNVRSACRG